MNERSRPKITAGDGDPRHGTANGYSNLQCRCRPCTDAVAVYIRQHHDKTRRNQRLRENYKALRAAGLTAAESSRRSHLAPYAKDTP